MTQFTPFWGNTHFHKKNFFLGFRDVFLKRSVNKLRELHLRIQR